jgi:excinuclease ABC subunit C
MTVILGGVPEKNAYRRFGLRGLASDKVNDIANLQEVLERRLNHPEWPWPELVVVDGGKAQLKVAKAILDNFGLTVPVVAVVKNEKHQPREILGDNRLTREYESEILLANSEAHRFAISYHRTKSRRGLR